MVVTNRFKGLDLIDRVPEELWMKAHNTVQEVKVKVAQSCLTLCDPMDYTVNGILQARILEWVAFPSCRGSSQPRDRTQVSCIVGRLYQLSHQGSP